MTQNETPCEQDIAVWFEKKVKQLCGEANLLFTDNNAHTLTTLSLLPCSLEGPSVTDIHAPLTTVAN